MIVTCPRCGFHRARITATRMVVSGAQHLQLRCYACSHTWAVEEEQCRPSKFGIIFGRKLSLAEREWLLKTVREAEL